MLVKYSTENLVCVSEKDKNNGIYFGIYEKGNKQKLIVNYLDKDNMLINNEILKNPENYKYIKELYEILEFLIKLEN